MGETCAIPDSRANRKLLLLHTTCALPDGIIHDKSCV